MINLRQSVLSASEKAHLLSSLGDFMVEPYSLKYSELDFLNTKKLLMSRCLRFFRTIITSFLKSSQDILVIKNCPVDPELDPTPNGDFIPEAKKTRFSENLLLITSSIVGFPFAIESENKGFLIHNIYPVRRYANSQTSKSSETLLTLHTELSCVRYPPDYVIMLGLRESQHAVITQVVKLDDILTFLSDEEIYLLTQPLYRTSIDESLYVLHTNKIKTNPFPILTRRSGANLWKYDFEYTEGLTAQSKDVVKKIGDLWPKLLFNITIQPGDLVMIDNSKIAHARMAFTAKYDGTDRWIQRVNVHKKLRKTFYTISEVITESSS